MKEIPRDAEAMGRSAWDRGEAVAAAGDIAGGRRWLERAHRLVPSDQNLAFALGLLRLRDGDPAAACRLFGQMADAHGGREAWSALAHCALVLNDIDRARHAVGRLLAGHVATPGAEALATRLAGIDATSAWCGLRADGSVAGGIALATAEIFLDGQRLRPRRLGDQVKLPPRWQKARLLRVIRAGADMIGSPIDIDAMHRTEGFVQATGQSITGWAWHPGHPEADPHVSVLDATGRVVGAVTATDLSAAVTGAAPLARPRGFTLSGLPAGLLRVTGPDGRDLTGSPLALPAARASMPKRVRRTRMPAPGPVCIIVPVYRGLRTTLDCLASVLATRRPGDRVVVVDDGAPDAELMAALRDLASTRAITLIPSCAGTPGRNLGFPGAANAGMRAAQDLGRDHAGVDLVLLNSDTLVFPGWLQGLQDAAYAAPDIGTATPLSNDATIFSYPDPARHTPMPDPAEAARLAAQSAKVNGGVVVPVPTAHGFCMFIRADCLAATGVFREDVFAQGYGEENDFTERAGAAGFRHVAAVGVYVAHAGGVSFGAARTHLLRRNQEILGQLHPGYHKRVAAFRQADPLRPARVRLDAARLAETPGEGAMLLVTHLRGGGTAIVVRDRVAALQAQGLYPVLLAARDGRTEVATPDSAFPNLSFLLPAELGALIGVLAPLRPVAMEVHQLLGHDHSITSVAAHFGIPTDVFLHDYAWLCPRVSFVTGDGFFCGEAAPAVCEPCVARGGRVILDPIPPDALRRRSAAFLTSARQVIAPHADGAARLRRHFPGVTPVVRPWQNDAALPPRRVLRRGPLLRVAVVGAIGLAKGFNVLLACAQDAAARALALEFVVVGYTIDDEALMATGRAFVTAEFAASECAALLRQQGADLALLPSVWPETWCYALSDVWAAGLDAAVFDIGAPAARVRATGRGWVLPLGLPPARVNDALLNLQPLGDTPVPQHIVDAYSDPHTPSGG